jgi:hypothetical protein
VYPQSTHGWSTRASLFLIGFGHTLRLTTTVDLDAPPLEFVDSSGYRMAYRPRGNTNAVWLNGQFRSSAGLASLRTLSF